VPWLKLLHITAVIVWCGALLYLPLALVALAQGAQGQAPAAGPEPEPMPGPHAGRLLLRMAYIAVATPAALLAIASGTLIFALHGPLLPWLVAKLGAVSLLVLVHAGCGALLLRHEAAPGRPLSARSGLLAVTAGGALAAAAWLVLQKPG
jgi:uncharacterized membrane protein